MFQLRLFVHRRLHAAAEEILREVEKTVPLTLYVHRLKEVKLDSLHRVPAADPPLTNTGEEALQETTTRPWIQAESNPGPSQTSPDTENSDGIDFMIKEEQEEFGVDGQTREVIFPSREVVKSETRVSYELRPVSSDCSAAQSESNDASNEEWVQSNRARTKRKRRKVLRRQNGSKKQKALLDGDSPAKSQKARRVCPTCGKSFQYVCPFMKHVKTHKKTSESTKELLRHLKRAHKKRLLCDVCGKKFTSPGSRQTHSKIHTRIKDFKCQDCGKSFNQKEHLIVHMRTHSGERPYRCRSHGKLFYTCGHLKTRMKRFLGEKPHSFHICGKLFCQRRQLIRHKNAHTAGSSNPYMCGKMVKMHQ